jgi:large subunit ribosomal protein L18
MKIFRAKTARAARRVRHVRVRHRLRGTGDRPRLAVFRSLNHIYAQIIDDDAGKTLVAASDMEAALRNGHSAQSKTDVAVKVGEWIASKAKQKGISQVVMDRAGFRYHGRVKALADAARKGGLEF